MKDLNRFNPIDFALSLIINKVYKGVKEKVLNNSESNNKQESSIKK